MRGHVRGRLLGLGWDGVIGAHCDDPSTSTLFYAFAPRLHDPKPLSFATVRGITNVMGLPPATLSVSAGSDVWAQRLTLSPLP